jgi:hypothetical protein
VTTGKLNDQELEFLHCFRLCEAEHREHLRGLAERFSKRLDRKRARRSQGLQELRQRQSNTKGEAREGKILALVPPAISAETADYLAYLLRETLVGNVIGIAGAIFHPGRNYSIDIVGAAEKDPTYTRGAVGALDDVLARVVGSK